jgi:hypothetical protein
MAYKRKPNYHFATKLETGIDMVPLGRIVVCEDYDGVMKFFILEDKTGITAGTTIEQALAALNLKDIASKSYVDTEISTLSAGKLANIVEDITPQLGGDLDFNGKTMNKSAVRGITDASLASGTHTFNYLSGDMQELTATGNITIAFSDMPAGDVAAFIIDAKNWGAYTITHPVGMLFAGGTAPSYTASGTDRLLVTKDKDNVYTLTVIAFDIRV